MSVLLDTSVLVRYLFGDPSELMRSSIAIIEGAEDLLVTDVALAETAFVLTTVYRVSREEIVDRLVGLVQRPNVATFRLEKDLVLQALSMCRPSRRVSIPDALIWAAARSDRASVYSFDQRFPDDGIEVVRAPR